MVENLVICYDSSVITYPVLLKIFFADQDLRRLTGHGNGHEMQTSQLFLHNGLELFIYQMSVSGLLY